MTCRLRWRATAWTACAVLCGAALALAGATPEEIREGVLRENVRQIAAAIQAYAAAKAAAPDSAPSSAPAPVLPPAPYALVSILGDPSFRHDGTVTQAAALADGKRLLTSAHDGTARLWDLATGRQLQCYRHSENCVYNALPLPGGERFLTTGGEGAVILWDVATGRRLKEFPHGAATLCVAVDAGGARAASGDSNGICIVWDLAGGRPLASFEAAGVGSDTSGGHPTVRAVCFGPDGNSVIAGCSDSTIRCWRLDSNREEFLKPKDLGIELPRWIGGPGDTGEVLALAASADRGRILVCCENRAPWMMDARGREVWRSRGLHFSCDGAWSPDGKGLAVVGERRLTVLEAAGGARRWSAGLSDGTHYAAAWNAPGTEVLAGIDNLLCRFDANTGRRTFPPPGARLQNREASAVPVPGTDLLLVCAGDYGGDAGIRVWDRRRRHLKETWLGAEAASQPRVSDDGLIAAVCTKTFVAALNARTGKEIRRWPTDSEFANLVLSPDGKWVYIQDEEGAGVWRVADGQRLLALSREQIGYYSGKPAFGPDLELAIPAESGSILVYKMPEGEVVQELLRPGRQDRRGLYVRESWQGLTFLPGEAPALVSWDSKELCLWAAAPPDANGLSEAEVARLVEQLSATSFQDREAATKRLVAGGRAVLPLLRKVESRDAETKARLLLVQKSVLAGSAMHVISTLELKEGGIASFALHPDGRRWALAHGQPPHREVLLGEVRDRELRPLGVLAAPHAARRVIFDSRGVLVTGNYNGTVCEYAPPPATQPASATGR